MYSINRSEERTGFQERVPYHPAIDLQTDFVMVYGIDDSMPQRIQEWQQKGYITHLMTGVAWGEYQDYLYGKVDGKNHWEEAQKNRLGDIISHGKDVPYMVPTIAYTDFLTQRIKKAVDAGVEAIHLEEPEFWVEGGYSEAFKREWQIYYKEPWKAPHESADAQYRASKLKAYLYKRCLDRLCGELKEYALVTYGRELRFYVPTHSLINYTQWRIVSPQSQLLDLPTIDGYIAQVWTGTSRTPNVYKGVTKERTFETAYLEYGMMQELARGTDRKIWFLHDPIEDNPSYDWEDYKQNYIKTLTASLFHPNVWHYEISPWPDRIFTKSYPKKDGTGKEKIPASYAATLLILMNTLRDLKQDFIEWDGNQDTIGVFLSDSAMFQRSPLDSSNEEVSQRYDGTKVDMLQTDTAMELLHWSDFYGLTLPFLKAGVPIRPVQLDNIRRFPSYLDPYRTLILSYEYMKPESPDIHLALSQWVQEGGCLIYVGDDSDPYHQAKEWWNQGEKTFTNPAAHLLEVLGIDQQSEQDMHAVGKGVVHLLRKHPKQFAQSAEMAEQLLTAVKRTKEAGKQNDIWEEQNYLLIRRGPYIISAVLDESVSEQVLQLDGLFVDLLDDQLTVHKTINVSPGKQSFVYDLQHQQDSQRFEVIAASSRIEEAEVEQGQFTFLAKGPLHVPGVNRIKCPEEPKKVSIATQPGKYQEADTEWEPDSHTLLLTYDNHPDGVTIQITL
ncbi:hypothetical protein [Gracilibacillus timonensis]|uniref:hypothetical protein n=1 Tax=Gracilibacillus timonensis TaxID=1816696 RepID=UPI000825BDF5|nr:hypothetical protein [Gracilibacillus timonensis]